MSGADGSLESAGAGMGDSIASLQSNDSFDRGALSAKGLSEEEIALVRIEHACY